LPTASASSPTGDEAINVFTQLPGDDPVLKPTCNHGVDSYDLGTGYNHIALGTEDLEGTLEGLASESIEPEKPPYWPGGPTEGLASASCATRTATGSS
jgi:hypothetical protein